MLEMDPADRRELAGAGGTRRVREIPWTPWKWSRPWSSEVYVKLPGYLAAGRTDGLFLLPAGACVTPSVVASRRQPRGARCDCRGPPPYWGKVSDEVLAEVAETDPSTVESALGPTYWSAPGAPGWGLSAELSHELGGQKVTVRGALRRARKHLHSDGGLELGALDGLSRRRGRRPVPRLRGRTSGSEAWVWWSRSGRCVGRGRILALVAQLVGMTERRATLSTLLTVGLPARRPRIVVARESHRRLGLGAVGDTAARARPHAGHRVRGGRSAHNRGSPPAWWPEFPAPSNRRLSRSR